MLQFHETQGFEHARLDLFFRHLFLAEAIGHIFLHRERIEQCAFLEDHSYLPPQLKELFLRHGRHFVTEDEYASRIRLEQPEGELEDGAFAGPCDSEEDLRFPASKI